MVVQSCTLRHFLELSLFRQKQSTPMGALTIIIVNLLICVRSCSEQAVYVRICVLNPLDMVYLIAVKNFLRYPMTVPFFQNVICGSLSISRVQFQQIRKEQKLIIQFRHPLNTVSWQDLPWRSRSATYQITPQR